MIGEVGGGLGHVAAVAGRADTAALAGEGHDEPRAARHADRAGEAEAEEPALEIAAEFVLDVSRHGPLGGFPPGEPALEVLRHDLVERRAALTERVRRRTIRWFRLAGLLNAAAAVDMLAWENSGFSVDASVRITLLPPQVRVYRQPLEHLLRYCARPPFALERLSVIRGPGGRIARIRSVLPRHKAATWVGPGRDRKSTRPGANGVVELSPFEFLDRLADLVPPPRKHRHRYHGVFAPKSKAPGARHLPDCLGETPGPGGGGVSARVPELRRRHPADCVHHPAGTDPEDSHTPRRTTRASTGVARSWPAHRLGRTHPAA
jgi:hypothetical protein